MELLLLKVPSELVFGQKRKVSSWLKRYLCFGLESLIFSRKQNKTKPQKSPNNIQKVKTNFEISAIFITSLYFRTAEISLFKLCRWSVVFNQETHFRTCWQNRLFYNILRRKTQLLQLANPHLSRFIHTDVKALDKDTVWLKFVKPRCVGTAAWAQMGPKSEHKETEEENY